LNTDYASVSRTLARQDVNALEDSLPKIDIFPRPQRMEQPTRPKPPVQVATTQVDPAVEDLVRRFEGFTLSVKQFEHLSNSNIALRRLLLKGENYAEAYKRLVIGPRSNNYLVLERNNRSF
jgi:hypothetical protein